MLLRNYDNIIAGRNIPHVNVSETFIDRFTTFGDKSLTIKSMTDEKVYAIGHTSDKYTPFNYFYNADFWNGSINTAGQSFITAGEGSAPVTYDDYNLEKGLTANDATKSVHNVSELVYDEEAKSWSRTYTCTCIAKRDLTIREIGIYYASDWKNAYGNTYNYPVLVYREVIDEVVVPANASFVLSFTTTVSANPNKPADYEATASVVE